MANNGIRVSGSDSYALVFSLKTDNVSAVSVKKTARSSPSSSEPPQILVRERSALATLISTLRVCLSVILSFVLSFCHSVCLSANSELHISETRPDSGIVTMDGLYKLAYGLSIGHTPDDVT